MELEKEFKLETQQVIGYGQYRVTYTSPNTGKIWAATTNDMTLIDKTKNAECPKRTDLERLKKAIKEKNQ